MRNCSFFLFLLIGLACSPEEPATPVFVPSLETLQGVWQIDSYSYDYETFETQNDSTTNTRTIRSFGPGLLLTFAGERYRCEGETVVRRIHTAEDGTVDTLTEEVTTFFGGTGELFLPGLNPMVMRADSTGGGYFWRVSATSADRAAFSWDEDNRYEWTADHISGDRSRVRMELRR